jgi:hypothetical protein
VSRSLHEPEALSASAPSRLPLSRLLLPAFAALLAVCAVALSLGLSPTLVAVAGPVLSASSGGPLLP